MNKALAAAITLAAFAAASLAQSSGQQTVKSGAPTSVFTNASLTASYVTGITIDLMSYDSVNISVYNSSISGTSIRTPSIKYQWSQDNSNWYDQYVLSTGTASATEQPYTPLARVIQPSLSTSATVIYSERERRLMRYFRPAVKADSATTATVLIKAQPMNNQN